MNEIFSIELSVKEQDRDDVKEAITEELNKMKEFGVIGKPIKWEGQEIVGTRMVVTESEKHDGQKKKVKARLVAQGFKEQEKSQSDSPTAHRESLRMFISVSNLLGFDQLSSLDVSAAFLQSDDLDREVYCIYNIQRTFRKIGVLFKS